MEFLVDILKIILEYLPLLEIIRNRIINKKWKQIIDSSYDNKEINLNIDENNNIVCSPNIEYKTYLNDEDNEFLDYIDNTFYYLLIEAIRTTIQKFNIEKSKINRKIIYYPDMLNIDQSIIINFCDGYLHLNQKLKIQKNEIKIMKLLFDFLDLIIFLKDSPTRK